MVKLQPELLISQNLPPILSKISPKEKLGQKWWEAERKLANEKSQGQCIVCGTHKKDKSCACGNHFAYKEYLEAHEIYEIDYVNSVIILKEVVAICHSCHNFIHSGRNIKQFIEGINSRNYITNILIHGITILSENNIKPLSHQALAYLTIVKGYTKEFAEKYILEKNLETELFSVQNIENWKGNY